MKTRRTLKAAALGTAAALFIPSMALASFAPRPPGMDDDPRCVSLRHAQAEEGVKALFFNSAWDGTTSSMLNGTNVCNHTNGRNLIFSMVEDTAARRASNHGITITVVGNTDRDQQTTNNLLLSWDRADSGRWYVERAMRAKYGTLPEPRSSLSGKYRVFTYDFASGSDVTLLMYGAKDSYADGTTTETKRADRNATVKIEVDPPEGDPFTESSALDDAFSFSYGDTYSGNAALNDTCARGPCTFSLNGAPSHGTASMNLTTGVVTFSPPQYFVGTLTAEYSILDANGSSGTANIVVSIAETATPAAPEFTHTAELSAPVWARLDTTESFSASASMNCTSGIQTIDRCTQDNDINGAFVRINSVRAATNTLRAPAGYATSRYSFNGIPAGSRLPASGSMRFAQATAAGDPFRVSVVVETRFQEGVFTRRNGAYQETLDNDVQIRFQNISASVGVVGATR